MRGEGGRVWVGEWETVSRRAVGEVCATAATSQLAHHGTRVCLAAALGQWRSTSLSNAPFSTLAGLSLVQPWGAAASQLEQTCLAGDRVAACLSEVEVPLPVL